VGSGHKADLASQVGTREIDGADIDVPRTRLEIGNVLTCQCDPKIVRSDSRFTIWTGEDDVARRQRINHRSKAGGIS
jgi:hypothetical protein